MPYALQRGFTLLEILIAVTIIAILGAVVAPKFMGKPNEAKIVAAKEDIRAIQAALSMYKLDNSRFPTTEQGLQALVTKPTTGQVPANWKAYLDRLPKDPWGFEYVYLNPGLHGEIDIMSYGSADGPSATDTTHQIGNWM
ncbi:type II secretion system major pseudopilin GspG [Burkholderiaceae bacterium DAT-1]|nr:type II secretion system major pseudopilin GspG [Burkholderiaceae bacterium DAT-1]